MLKTKKAIKNWLDRYDIENYTINEDLTVDVDDSIYLINENLKIIPIKFNVISGSFNCCYNKLTSLEFAPKEVVGYFDCSNNNLTSLEFAPKKVGFSFICSNNPFKNNIYNELDLDEILDYLKNESLKKELDKEINNRVVKRIKI